MSDSYFTQTRSEMLAFVPSVSGPILDIGCGAGGFLSLVKQSRDVSETWGVDLLPPNELKFEPDHYFSGPVELSIDKLPRSHFDLIIVNDVLEHLVKPDEVLKRLARLLTPGGRIIGSIPNVLHWTVLEGLLMKGDWKYEDFGILDRTHLRFFTRKSILRMFSESDLVVEKIVGINGQLSAKALLLLLFSLGLLRETFPLQWAVVASKGSSGGRP